jgi:hypothetical protein
MERKFYPENFERFLKGHADQFKMTPSKKVWHGIYNDLHPGRRWPSIAMSMVFIFTLVIIGHLNTNNGHYTALPDITPSQISNIVKSHKVLLKHSNLQERINNNTPTDNINANALSSATPPLLSVIKEDQSSSNNTGSSRLNETKSSIALENKTEFIPAVENNIYTSNTDKIATSSQEITNKINEETPVEIISNKDIQVSSYIDESPTQIQANTNTIQKRKRNSNVTWMYYVSPSLSYRHFSDNSINNSVTQKPIIGYEAGTAMSFNLIKKLQFTTGFQLNYSGYNIKANNTHPIVATIILNSETPGQYSAYSNMSHYGNSASSELITLKNYNVQASIPIGLQYIFAANENIKIGAAAALQPTFTILDKAYLLSTDKKNYLTAPNLYRSLNMNTNFTTYISFSSNSLNWQIGPQVRYQVLSSYSNSYPVKEHLINYGIRLGISKISK